MAHEAKKPVHTEPSADAAERMPQAHAAPQEEAMNAQEQVPSKAPKADSKEGAMRQMGPYLNLGMELFAAVAGFGLIGWFIDSKAGTSPLWMLILLFAGAIGGMYNLIRVALKSAPQKPKETTKAAPTDATKQG